jgi:hypothetical protein
MIAEGGLAALWLAAAPATARMVIQSSIEPS